MRLVTVTTWRSARRASSRSLKSSKREMSITLFGSVDGPTTVEIRERVDAAVPHDWPQDKRQLAHILAEYDHANAPSNWEPQYKRETFMLQWADDLYDRKPDLCAALAKAWNQEQSIEDKGESCGQFGPISNLMYEEMMDWYC